VADQIKGFYVFISPSAFAVVHFLVLENLTFSSETHASATKKLKKL